MKPIIAILALIVIVFWVGRMYGLHSASIQQTKNDIELQKELVELERSLLTNVVTQSNMMTSGLYTLEVWYAGKPEKISDVQLEFTNGKLVSNMPMLSIVQAGNVVSWDMAGPDKEPSEEFVGVIDGKTMWGQAYLGPGQGWHQGEPPAYGVWKLSPKPIR